VAIRLAPRNLAHALLSRSSLESYPSKWTQCLSDNGENRPVFYATSVQQTRDRHMENKLDKNTMNGLL